MITMRTRYVAVVAGLALLGACGERPPVDTAQLGYRGVGMEQVTNPRLYAARLADNQVPAAPPAAEPGPPGPWQNVQVLTDVSAAEFTRQMTATSEWIVPDSWVDPKDINRANKCAYCHNLANMASDEKYTKVVARRMYQMTRDINGNYTNHVQQTGVTCYSCHRGNPVPQNIWFYTDQNQAYRYFVDRPDVRVQSASFVPSNDNRSSIKQTEYTYAVMLHMSNGLGVNCGFCHNSRQWSDWSQSTPQRMTALRGARMVRDLNSNYLVPLQPTWPKERLGPHGDGAKLMCATCHNGVNKPLYGAAMAKDYPSLYPGGMGSATTTMPTTDSTGAAVTPPADATAPTAHVMPSKTAPGAGAVAPRTATPPTPAAVPANTGPEGVGAMGGSGQSGKNLPTDKVPVPQELQRPK
ncbi:MAG TPA: photosynthetic reaction center cytochrome PufC [Gemmatimonadales bacterium]|nr:photosynthetic reaction center cytochrome PufC [Gemmatimonadales bacterium]